MKQFNNVKSKIAIAMSGGVDSSVAAKMLVDEGHEVIGLFLKLWSDPTCRVAKENRCCNYEALEDARKVANALDIPFYVINAEKEFKKAVVDDFLLQYQDFKTPNPCIVCNEKIKFDLLLKKALSIGCDYLATGHYARITQNQNDKYQISNKYQNPKSKKEQLNNGAMKQLFCGIDPAKDQSYMLYRLNQEQLSKIMFPLGEMTKKVVRTLAVRWDLPVKEKPESQEICFFGDKDYRFFLKRYLPAKYFKPGEIVDNSGNVLGKHEGLINYTIGQRKGIEIIENSKIKMKNCNSKLKNNQQPLYVIGYDLKNNQLIIGEDREVYKKEMIVGDLNWINPTSYQLIPNSCSVKIRYRHPAVPCDIACHPRPDRGSKNSLVDSRLRGNDVIKVLFKQPQRAITPGQSAVFYKGDEVLGGGIIEG